MEEFLSAVEEGLDLSRRIYFGKDRSVAPPKQLPPTLRSSKDYLPTAPMVYAVVSDPSIVDNPDIPSYQPYVYGRCDPPALIPLQMNKVSLEVDCYLDTVFVRVSGQWRVHCVMGNKACDCRIAVPMGEQGSILGVEVDIPRKSYHTELVTMQDKRDEEKSLSVDDGVFLRPDIFLLTVPQVDGGTNLSINITWSQKLMYHDGEFSVCVPFSFPEYVTPASKKIPRREKIQLNVHPGGGTEVMCKNISHPLKEQKRLVENLSFLHESDVLTWSSSDFSFSFSMPTGHVHGSVLLQSPAVDDVDQRDMFCIYMHPGSSSNKKFFARKIVYVIDISGSMEGKPLSDTKKVLYKAVSELSPEDSFNIIAFNGQTVLFSPSLKLASKETIDNALNWIDVNLVAGDGTNISLAMSKALEMLSDAHGSLPMIFLLTDGAVEDERDICQMAETFLSNAKGISPRIHTFGIGLFCNHYFLRMLAMIGRGCYYAAYKTDSVESRLLKLFGEASATVLANLTFDTLHELGDVEVKPAFVPDLSSEGPLMVSGRYRGKFPDILKGRGIIAGMMNYEVELKVKKAKEIPLERILATHQINLFTAEAWLSDDKQLEKKIAQMSIRNGVASEYTSMAIFVKETLKKAVSGGAKQKKTPGRNEAQEEEEPKPKKIKVLRNLGIGFGNLKATVENVPPGFEELKPPEVAEVIVKEMSDCCTKVCGYCCCMCCVQVCSKVNNQCAIVLTQCLTAIAWFGCLSCCVDICCSGNDGS